MKISSVNIEKRKNIDLRAGDMVRVWQKIKEKDKFSLQAFWGLVLARKHGKEAGARFTVRRVVQGIGVERIFPLYSPVIDKIEVLKRSKVKRSKLYHIREKAAKEIRRQMRHIRMERVEEEAEETIQESNSDKEKNAEPVAMEPKSESLNSK